jgi:hypothetical protein
VIEVVVLFEVMFVYLVLGAVVLSAAWALIAHRGFEGLERTNSPLAKFFKTRFAVVTDSSSETNANVNEVVPSLSLATAVIVVMLVLGKPNIKTGCQSLHSYEDIGMSRKTSVIKTQIVEIQVLDANVY